MLFRSVVTFIVLFIIQGKIEIIILTTGFIVSSLAIAETLGRKQFKSYSRYFVVQKILFVVFGILLYNLYGVNGILYGLAISFIPYTYQILQGVRDSKIHFLLIRERLVFLLTNFAYTFAGVARGQVDKLIIAPILVFEVLGNYSFALQIVAVLMIFPNIIYKYTVPVDSSGKSTA